MKRWIAILAAFTLTLALLTACGSSSTADGGDTGDMGAGGTMPSDPGWVNGGGESMTDTAGDAAPQEGQTAKKIYTAHLEAETTDFDTAQSDLGSLVDEVGGYFANRSVSSHSSYRYGDYTVRVPAAQFETFLSRMGETFYLTYSTDSEEDVTEAYYDIEARLTTQRTKLERLQDLLSKADNMADIITIESAISETELTIEQLTGSLQTYDNRIEYATITISLSEVYKLSNVQEPVTTFGGRIQEAFSNGLRLVVDVLEGLVVLLAYLWVWLVLLAVVVIAAVVLRRRSRRRHLPPGSDSSDEKK